MELHITKEKDSSTIGAQLICTHITPTVEDQCAVNCDDDTKGAINYIVDKYIMSHGRCDVFVNGITRTLI